MLSNRQDPIDCHGGDKTVCVMMVRETVRPVKAVATARAVSVSAIDAPSRLLIKSTSLATE
jgi:hypothetical protein